jgi:predicted DNA-binding protein
VVSKKKGKQTPITGYYLPEVAERLNTLTEATRVRQADYLREALDDLLKKYAATLRKGVKHG